MNWLVAIPAVIALIKAAEDIMPTGPSKDKLEFVIKSIEEITGVLTDGRPKLEGYIAIIVKLFNALGIFKRYKEKANPVDPLGIGKESPPNLVS